MRVGKTQLDAFAVELERDFEARVATYLTQQLPQVTSLMTRDALIARVQGDLAVARGFGIERDPDLAKWCFLSLVAGPRFHESPDVHAFLKDDLVLPTTKVENLMRSLAIALDKQRSQEVSE